MLLRTSKRLSRWRLASVSVVACLVLGGGSRPFDMAAAQPAAPAAVAAADAWQQFRGNPQLTGVSASSLPATPKVLWSYEAGAAVESSPAIGGGAVFVASQAGELIALDLKTGALLWKYRTSEPIGESSPAVGGGLVFVGDLGGVVHAVKAADGARAWTFKTLSEIKSSPVVVGDKVLVGSYDGHLYALSARQGELAWKVEFDNYVHATPAVADGVAFITGCDETFRGIRVSDGTEVFKLATGAYTGASPAIVGDRAYFGTFNNEVLALDLKSRKVAWRYEHPERRFPFYSSPAATGEIVVIGGRDKLVHGIDAATGRALWTLPTGARVESSPAIAGQRAYVGSGDGRLYVVDLKTGRSIWEHDAGSPISSSPAIASNRLVVSTEDGRVLCVG